MNERLEGEPSETPQTGKHRGIIDPRDSGPSREFQNDLGVKPLRRWRVDLTPEGDNLENDRDSIQKGDQ